MGSFPCRWGFCLNIPDGMFGWANICLIDDLGSPKEILVLFSFFVKFASFVF